MDVESLMMLYRDDSVEVHYAGGSLLLLSPCCFEYLYEAALPASAHPLQPAETTHQWVAFIVSAYRILFSDVLEVRWPDPSMADLTTCIENGSVKISSVDGHVHLYLSELQQELTIEFLCKVSQSSAASLRSSQKNSNYQTRYIRTAIEWCRSLHEWKEIPEYTARSVTEENCYSSSS